MGSAAASTDAVSLASARMRAARTCSGEKGSDCGGLLLMHRWGPARDQPTSSYATEHVDAERPSDTVC